MTILQQIKYIKTHPFYASALGSESDLDLLLFEVMFHTYSVCSVNSTRAYRRAVCMKMNAPEILAAVRDVEPPVNLDLRLPIPSVCRVVSMKNPAEPVKDCRLDLEEG